MTTQVQTVFLYGPKGGRKFSKTQTDTTAAEITSTTGTLSLYKLMKGQTLTHYMAEFAAGIGVAWIRNTYTDVIKAVLVNEVIGEMRYRRIRRPFVVQDGDILEGYVDVA
jgi:hypothetical protein